MQNRSSFIISGIIAISFYVMLCLGILFYIMSPEPKMISIAPTSTTIELDMIVEKSDKKMIQKKAEKKIEKEEVQEKT
ncbi:MAG: hypothetical protein RBR65_09755, partial [Aliarcobacter sp.]|nr:hypothetical protein [Aliarcobacter sp.]